MAGLEAVVVEEAAAAAVAAAIPFMQAARCLALLHLRPRQQAACLALLHLRPRQQAVFLAALLHLCPRQQAVCLAALLHLAAALPLAGCLPLALVALTLGCLPLARHPHQMALSGVPLALARHPQPLGHPHQWGCPSSFASRISRCYGARTRTASTGTKRSLTKIHGQIVHELRKREAKGSYNTRWRPRGWHATPRAVQGAAQHLHVGLIVRPLIPAAEVVNVQAVHLLCPAHP